MRSLIARLFSQERKRMEDAEFERLCIWRALLRSREADAALRVVGRIEARIRELAK